MHKVIERILNLLAFLLTVGRPATAEEIRYTVKGYDQPTDEASDPGLVRQESFELETV